MIVVPVDTLLTSSLALLSFGFELFRIIIGYIIGKPPDKIRTLTIEKLEAQREVSQIKSVQLELVRHSLLTRKIIKIEKEIEKIQGTVQPRSQSVKFISRIVRAVVYLGVGIYFYQQNLVMVNPELLWPLSWFTSKSLVSLPAWFVLFSSGLAWRHVMRTFLQVFFRSSTFP